MYWCVLELYKVDYQFIEQGKCFNIVIKSVGEKSEQGHLKIKHLEIFLQVLFHFFARNFLQIPLSTDGGSNNIFSSSWPND
jgi:hypothetical protein